MTDELFGLSGSSLLFGLLSGFLCLSFSLSSSFPLSLSGFLSSLDSSGLGKGGLVRFSLIWRACLDLLIFLGSSRSGSVAHDVASFAESFVVEEGIDLLSRHLETLVFRKFSNHGAINIVGLEESLHHADHRASLVLARRVASGPTG